MTFPDILVLVRHAEKTGDNFDADITPHGVWQARKTGDWLRKRFHWGISKNVTSEYWRARQMFHYMFPGASYEQEWRVNECGYGENENALSYRIRPFLDSLHAVPRSSVLVTAHSGSICAIRAELEGISIKKACKVRPDYASVTIYRRKEEALRLYKFNIVPWAPEEKMACTV